MFLLTLKDDGEGSRRNIFSQGKEIKDMIKYYTLKDLEYILGLF
jgi:hypothetical protein